MAANEKLHLGVGNISHEVKLGSYYQDFTPAIYHFEHNSFGEIDEDGIPYLYSPEGRTYTNSI